MDNVEFRLSKLEEWRGSIDIALAKAEVDRKHIDKRFDAIEDILKESKQTVKWLNRTIIGALVVWFVQFVLRGGLATIGVK